MCQSAQLSLQLLSELNNTNLVRFYVIVCVTTYHDVIFCLPLTISVLPTFSLRLPLSLLVQFSCCSTMLVVIVFRSRMHLNILIKKFFISRNLERIVSITVFTNSSGIFVFLRIFYWLSTMTLCQWMSSSEVLNDQTLTFT